MTNTTPHGQVPAIQRYKIGYASDEWGVRTLNPVGIYDDAGPWVRYEDHAAVITALRTQQPAQAAQQEPASVDLKTMQLAESVGLIGPASRTNDLHAAIQRFHDLVCANATIKAAQMAAEAISEAAPQQDAQKPAAWKHDCAALLMNDVELWIAACPHCGKPRTALASQSIADS